MHAGWPKRVTVVAASAGAAGCRVSGHALAGVTCHAQHTLCLTVFDRFDNPRCMAGSGKHFLGLRALTEACADLRVSCSVLPLQRHSGGLAAAHGVSAELQPAQRAG